MDIIIIAYMDAVVIRVLTDRCVSEIMNEVIVSLSAL